jgi:5-methylcytosine-specific restriction endonuclease McrA
MSIKKQQERAAFRKAVFSRDKNRCRVCGQSKGPLDAHHITDRNLMPGGGYVAENGISLCGKCHEQAEVFHQTGTAPKSWAPDDLYHLIGSSYEKALKASQRKS